MPPDFPIPASPGASRLLGPCDPEPVGVVDPDSRSRFFVICDHAGNAVPASLGDLGLPRSELDRHIGIDIGALAVAQGLAGRLGASLVYQRYSRLVVDCNRRPEVTDSMAAVSDGTGVPGNQALSAADRTARIEAILTPYHRTVGTLLDRRAAQGLTTLLVSVHSFTPILRTRPAERPWHMGLCWGHTDVFSRAILTALAHEAGLVVGENQPYCVEMEKDYSIPVHGEERGLPYVEFEIRQDLLATTEAAEVWADRLARVLTAVAEQFMPNRRDA
jgi:predicted N-formylglutamate amidohydrolase